MKKSLTAFLPVIAVLALAGAGLLTAQERQGPRIEVKETRYDFGKVVQGAQVSHLFEVKSAGSEPLLIERAQPS